MALEQEMTTYKRHIKEWSDPDHVGKYVLIKEEEVGGFFSSYEDALNRGYEKYNLAPFLVKQIMAIEPVQFMSRELA